MTLEVILQTVLAAASVGLGFFCFVLGRRLRRLNDLETGLGGAIAVMAAEVDRLEKAILAARDEARSASQSLADQIDRAHDERAQWELRRKIAAAAPLPPLTTATRRLRKRTEPVNA